MFGITLRTCASAEPFWELVEQAAVFEKTSSLRALGYPPHITMTRYKTIELSSLAKAAEMLQGERAFSLIFDHITFFDIEPLVLWLAPRHNQRLFDAHARLSDAVPPNLCDPNYKPKRWRPHLTIAAAVEPSQRDAALHFTERSIRPFELIFDMVDCVSWPPVHTLRSRTLG